MRGSSSKEPESFSSAPLAAVAGVVLGLVASGVARGQTGGGEPPPSSSAPAGSAGSRSKAAGLASASPGGAESPGPSDSVAPSASPSASAGEVPAGSSSAEPVPAAPASGATPEDSGGPSPSASVEPPAAPSGSSFGSELSRPYLPGYPRPDSVPRAPEREISPLARLEAGGSLSQGLDATDGSTRSGGLYAGAMYPASRDFVFTGKYAVSSGHVVERLPGNRIGSFGVPNDVDVLETRHAFGFDVGYVGRLTDGPLRAFVMPLVGPRVVVFKNDVAPRWAFDADLGLRAGVWVSDALEASTFFAVDPSIAKESDVPDVQGTVLNELRFGAGTHFRTKGPIGVAIGYEGDVVVLEHQKLSAHSLVLGLSYAL